MKPVKLGIIGTGIAATDLHWPGLKNLKDYFEIVSVCNHTEPKAKEFSKLVGNVPYVTDYREILNNPDIEAVDIALPIELNCKVTKEALESGKHVIVEKPIATNMEEAEEMLTFESKYRKVMMVAENFRYDPVYVKVKEYIDKGRIGKPCSVFWNCYNYMELSNKYAQTKWRIDHKYPGGYITDAGVHNIAVLRYLFGEITSGISFTKSVNRSIGEIDSMSFLFNTESGVNGVFNSYFSANGHFERRLIILGTEGSMTVDDNKITLKKDKTDDVIDVVETDCGYQVEFEDFYHAIREGRKVRGTFKEAYMDLKTIINALNSAKEFDKLKF
jgi:predicted dehydrogenase